MCVSHFSHIWDSCYVAASTLQFDDIEKQKKYKEISFEEVNKEVVELKVFFVSKYTVACNLHSVVPFIDGLSYAVEPVYLCICFIFLLSSGWGMRFDMVHINPFIEMLFFYEVELLPGLSPLWIFINLVSVTSWTSLALLLIKLFVVGVFSYN